MFTHMIRCLPEYVNEDLKRNNVAAILQSVNKVINNIEGTEAMKK